MAKEVWGEPVGRPDGSTMAIYTQESGAVDVLIDYVGWGYSSYQAKLIGEGDYDRGVARIGQAAYRGPHAKDLGTVGPFTRFLHIASDPESTKLDTKLALEQELQRYGIE